MAAKKTRCPLCKIEVSWQGFEKHVHSRAHASELADSVKSQAAKCCQDHWKALPNFWAGDKQYHVCFGCKLVKRYPDSDHLYSCKQAKEHRAYLKKIAEDAATPLEVSGNEQLEKRIKELEERLKKKKKECDDADEKIVEKEEELEKYICLLTGLKFTEGLNYIDELRASDEGLIPLKQLMEERRLRLVEVAPPAALSVEKEIALPPNPVSIPALNQPQPTKQPEPPKVAEHPPSGFFRYDRMWSLPWWDDDAIPELPTAAQRLEMDSYFGADAAAKRKARMERVLEVAAPAPPIEQPAAPKVLQTTKRVFTKPKPQLQRQ